MLNNCPHDSKHKKIERDDNQEYKERNDEISYENSDRAAVFARWPVFIDQKRNRKGHEGGVPVEEGV